MIDCANDDLDDNSLLGIIDQAYLKGVECVEGNLYSSEGRQGRSSKSSVPVIFRNLRSGREYSRSVSLLNVGQTLMKCFVKKKVHFCGGGIKNAIDISNCDDDMMEAVDEGKSNPIDEGTSNVIEEETHNAFNEGMVVAIDHAISSYYTDLDISMLVYGTHGKLGTFAISTVGVHSKGIPFII